MRPAAGSGGAAFKFVNDVLGSRVSRIPRIRVPDTRWSFPDTKITVPDTRWSIPDTKITVPDTRWSIPDTKITVPDTVGDFPDTPGGTPVSGIGLPYHLEVQFAAGSSMI